jgi:hypothetical protein
LFGEAKEFMGFRRAKFRRIEFVREQVLMTATAQNIKRMVKLLSRKGPKNKAAAALYSNIASLIDRFSNYITWLFQRLEKYRWMPNCVPDEM